VAFAFAFRFRGQGAQAETADLFNEDGKLGGRAVVPGDAAVIRENPASRRLAIIV
jgi:hypothetical protein